MFKTSTRIALRFSSLTALLLVIFGVIINLIFFWFWVQGEQRLLKVPLEVKWRIQLSEEAKRWLREYFQDTALIAKDTELAEELLEKEHRFLNLVVYEDHRYMSKEFENYIVVRDVTRPMEQQMGLIRLSLLLLIICTIVSYLLGRVFVRTALRDLDKLVEHVQNLDVRSLSKPLLLTHLPPWDELLVVTEAINKAHASLHEQIEVIKRFVSHASHEMKTPLMIMQTDSELAIKAKNYQQWLEKNIATIGNLNRLLEALLLMTRWQQQSQIQNTSVSLATIIKDLVTTAQKCPKNTFQWDVELDEFIIQVSHQGMVERVITNLLDNAMKYTPPWGKITLRLTPEKLILSDTGVGISPESVEKIREPFWQADSSKWRDSGFGLWLSLVKQLIKLLWWTITVSSVQWEWTTFVIYFDQKI